MIVGESQGIPHPFIPPESPESVRSGEVDESEDSKSSMVVTKLGRIGWSKKGGDHGISKRETESREGEEREKESRDLRAGREDAKKGVQAMRRHAKRRSGNMDSRPSHDSTNQVNINVFIAERWNVLLSQKIEIRLLEFIQ